MTDVKFESGSLMMTRIMFGSLKENIKEFMHILGLKRRLIISYIHTQGYFCLSFHPPIKRFERTQLCEWEQLSIF